MAGKKKQHVNAGIGLDLGTMNIVAARKTEDDIILKRMRDVFLTLPLAQKKMLRLAEASFVERDDEIIILGDNALALANAFGHEPRRPLSGGLISPRESDALGVLKVLVQSVLGTPAVENEVCYFSVPAPPIDQQERDIIYHRGVFERIVEECGYDPFPANEAMAIIFSECASEGFSGLSFSFGSGMVNVALALNTIEAMSFSVGKGGDWVDQHSAQAVGQTQARMCALKENGIDLLEPRNQPEEALSLYYKALIEQVLDQVAHHFLLKASQFQLPEAIPIIVSGGTSKAGSFLPFFEKVWQKKMRKLPLKISEIRAAKDPLNAVAYGMLVQALQEYESE